ncbi:PD-(D/E)XK nuclease family protein [Coxiella endosymbiont of Ornithodoros maritimus]|uniref:PD-(D/E)XK nuclease family protein n=1 Tax=Coxiella endosymbiont of Ornithodoros maritimus TaxID=1656172 RepID=UPI0022641793|nr:PD-(D/E)XK nuclease family protein [Coxiella endosymbiont of Ornithodoros maritimus]
MYRELFLRLNEDTIVLTANRRLAHYLSKEYAQYQLNTGKKVWSTPSILPLTTWLFDCWQRCPQAEGILLTDFQEQFLWRKIVPLLDKTALLAKEAWRLMKAWELSTDELKLEANSEVQCFIDWALQFQKGLEQNQWISSAELPEQLQLVIPHLKLPKQIILIGFDELAPNVQQLFAALEKKITIAITQSNPYEAQWNTRTESSLPLVSQRTSYGRINFQNNEMEIQTMARWAYAQWEKEPNQKIGCVIPDLVQRRTQVLRLFTEIFGSSKHFNISVAESLTQIPLTQTALKCLELDPFKIDIMQLGTVFRSSYTNSSTADVCLAAQLDVKLRESEHWQANPALILYHLNQLQPNFQSTTLTTRCQTWLSKRSSTSLFPSAWAQQFSEELTAIGWPGQQSLDSKEYQQWKRWENLLHEYAALDTFTQQQTRKNALQLLRQLAHHTLFQPMSSQNSSIQILGLLETTGHYFDKLWIAGLNDKKWPPAASPNPFLPLSLQRRCQMPHASAKREMDYTLQLQNRLLKSAPAIILSAPLQEGDIQLSASPLIRHFPKINNENLQLPGWQPLKAHLFKIKMLETIEDAQAPALQENEPMSGGSSLLQSQSTCPFQAFAKVRLQAKPLNKPHTGLNAVERGNFVHQTLDLVWKKIKDWQTLNSSSDGGLENIIDETITHLVSQEKLIQPLFLNTEKKRLKQLVKKWLLLEKKRPPFEVSQQETKRHIKIGPLRLEVRIDRIDNNRFIIDYKTGSQNSVDDWFGDRLKNIQLPLYCAYAAREAIGIAYAEVRSQKMTFKGLISANEKFNSFSQVKPSPLTWDELIRRWKMQLYHLAVDFSSGKADVDPVDSKTVCKVCHLHSLCRIGEIE